MHLTSPPSPTHIPLVHVLVKSSFTPTRTRHPTPRRSNTALPLPSALPVPLTHTHPYAPHTLYLQAGQRVRDWPCHVESASASALISDCIMSMSPSLLPLPCGLVCPLLPTTTPSTHSLSCPNTYIYYNNRTDTQGFARGLVWWCKPIRRAHVLHSLAAGAALDLRL